MATVRRSFLFVVALITLAARPAGASFHLMQIEQVVGGVSGDLTAQAIQLRMRLSGQNFVAGVELKAWDAAGANPVTLLTFPTNVTNGSFGARILVASPGFAAHVSPTIVPDFIMTSLIPPSYLPAGSITYEDGFGTILWRLSWGDGSYTGSGLGSLDNDADGNFSPPFAGALPSTTLQALQFKFGASSPSTNNANDYQITAGAATFTNNLGGTGVTPVRPSGWGRLKALYR